MFVGRLPATIRKEDLSEHFEKYGTLRDVYIPQPFRGFAFITFLTGEEAEMVIREQHIIKGEGHPVCVADCCIGGAGLTSSVHSWIIVFSVCACVRACVCVCVRA